MVVVDPHQVVGLQQIYEGVGILPVYAAVHPVAIMIDDGLARKTVKERPESLIREVVAESLHFILGKGHGGQPNASGLCDLGERGALLSVRFSVLPHPDAS